VSTVSSSESQHGPPRPTEFAPPPKFKRANMRRGRRHEARVTTRDRHTTREAAANTPWVAILRWNRSTAGTDAAGPICARDAAYRDDAPRSTSPRPNAAAHGRAEASRGLQEAAEDDAEERDLRRRRRRAEAALYMGEGKWGAVVTAGAGAGAGGLLEAGMLCGRARRRGWGKLGISGLGLGPSPWLASPGGVVATGALTCGSQS
jgi:hypothetical protein